MVRTLFIAILVLVSVSWLIPAGVSAQARRSTQLDARPFDFSIGWMKSSDVRVDVPSQSPYALDRAGTFTGTLSWRPFRVFTTSVALANTAVRGGAVTADVPRVTAGETQFALGAALATDWMNPFAQRAGWMVVRFRGGAEYDLSGTDLRVQTMDAYSRVTQRDLASVQEHRCFVSVDIGWREPLGRAVGTVYLSIRYNRILPEWDGLPLGSATDLARDRLQVSLGITR